MFELGKENVSVFLDQSTHHVKLSPIMKVFGEFNEPT